MPLNKSMTQKRLMSLKSKFQRDPVYHQKYSEVMKDMIVSGYAETAPLNELSPAGRTWYIPHHSVQQPDKLRVVFDCNVQFQGENLNDKFLQGPNLINLFL